MRQNISRKASLLETMIPIICLALFLGIGIFMFESSSHVPLIVGAIGVYRLGFKWSELEISMFDSIKMAMQAILIIMIIGILIGIWVISGVVQSMIY